MLTAVTVGMDSMPTVEVVETLLVTIKRKGVFCRKISVLEYEGFRKDSSTYLSPSVHCGMSVSVRLSSIRRGGRKLSVRCMFPGIRGGGLTAPILSYG